MFRSTHRPVRRRRNLTGPAAGRPTEEPPAEGRIARERATEAQETLTLETPCACGHTRRDHRGLRIEVAGSCLECECEEFRSGGETPDSHEQTMKRIRTALDRVERLQEIAARLRAHAQKGGSRPGE
ncbi:MAG: hypothetical protein ACLPUT_06460 [Solirubrobacteraceae bacterium]|jgi:hypothetical protein